MEIKKACFIDDSVQGVGGTSLTLDAIVEPMKDNVTFISTLDLSLSDVFKPFDVFILGNLTNFSKNSLDSLIFLMTEKPFCKIEFDYGYCEYRGDIPHQKIKNEDCDCPFGSTGNEVLAEIYSLIKENSLHTFYMSKPQMDIHSKHLNWDEEKNRSVLSSCFTSQNIIDFDRLSKNKKNEKYAIIDGNGGWHTVAKGVKESIEYAKKNNIDFDLIKTQTHEEMLELLSKYKGLISLPIIDDTCPRITLEARYMGLKVITNQNSQQTQESWWNESDRDALEFTKSRPSYFWEKLKSLMKNI